MPVRDQTEDLIEDDDEDEECLVANVKWMDQICVSEDVWTTEQVCVSEGAWRTALADDTFYRKSWNI